MQMTPGQNPPELLPSVQHIVAVSSGKGGVGKSTVSVNLSVALSRSGKAVGLLDADIYGPNIPMMMGVKEQPEATDGKIIPLESHGVKLMSLGLIAGEDTPVIWRGPIVGKMIQQFLVDVAWGAHRHHTPEGCTRRRDSKRRNVSEGGCANCRGYRKHGLLRLSVLCRQDTHIRRRGRTGDCRSFQHPASGQHTLGAGYPGKW